MSEISKKELKKKLEKMEEELKLLNEEKNKPPIPEKPIKLKKTKQPEKIIGRSPYTPSAIEVKSESESEEDEQPKIIEKPKRQRSEKQMEQFKKATLIKQQKAEERKRIKEEEQLKFKKELEEKLVQKAIKLKKKQIKQNKVIYESESEPEEPPITKIEKIKPIGQSVSILPKSRLRFV